MSHAITIPAEAKVALTALQKRLPQSLLAVYLHGSAVEGGFRPRSDVVLLVVINRVLTPQEQIDLSADLMAVSGHYPIDVQGRRPLEVIIFLQSELVDLRYPAKCEFIYGEWLRHDYESGVVPQPISDPELTLMLAQAHKNAIPLLGQNIQAFLSKISQSEIQQAIKDCLPTLLDSVQGDERNVVLTLARMWYTSITHEFASKNIAAQWAAERLPVAQASILYHARNSYLNGGDENWQNCQQELQQTIQMLQTHIQSC